MLKRKLSPRLLLFVLILTGISMFFAYTYLKSSACGQIPAGLEVLSKEELSHYDGIQNEKVYIGYQCLIYDVTEGKDIYYGEGKGYHYLVGRDATKQLEIFGGDIIKEKYPVVGVLKQ